MICAYGDPVPGIVRNGDWILGIGDWDEADDVMWPDREFVCIHMRVYNLVILPCVEEVQAHGDDNRVPT